jgi:hypothetical protein
LKREAGAAWRRFVSCVSAPRLIARDGTWLPSVGPALVPANYGRDLTSTILAHWVAALVDDRAQLLRPDTGASTDRSMGLANSDEALAVANAIDEDE